MKLQPFYDGVFNELDESIITPQLT